MVGRERDAVERGRVSVVIPTYYRNERLREAIESVETQTYPDVELIVVDDSGEGHARPVVDPYDLHYVAHEENRGGNPARNSGIEVASGTYIKLLDDDDRLHERTLERQVAVLQRSPNAGVVYSGFQPEGRRVMLPSPRARGDVLDRALAFEMRACVPSTMLIDAEVLREVCPLADREGADDVGLVVELARRTEFEHLDEPLVVKGIPECQRSQGLGVPRELERMLEQYADLYDRHDPSVRSRAKRNIHCIRGTNLLNAYPWSARAIAAYWRALYHAEGVPWVDLGAAFTSLFGRPGRRVGVALHQRLTADGHVADGKRGAGTGSDAEDGR